MHYYKFNIADWHLGTSHLSLVEEAIYFRLINLYYDTESPIPLDTQSVVRRLRLGSELETVERILVEFFTKTRKGFTNARCDENLRDYKKLKEKNSANGKKGGKARNGAASKVTQSLPSGLPNETQSEANSKPPYKPLTTNQEPKTINQESAENLSDSQRYAAAADCIKKLGKISVEEFFDKFSEWREFVIFKRPDLADDPEILKSVFEIYAGETGSGLRDDWFQRWEEWILRERRS